MVFGIIGTACPSIGGGRCARSIRFGTGKGLVVDLRKVPLCFLQVL